MMGDTHAADTGNCLFGTVVNVCKAEGGYSCPPMDLGLLLPQERCEECVKILLQRDPKKYSFLTAEMP